MGFSNQERINLFTKTQAANVFDANATAVWYESSFPYRLNQDGSAILTQLSSIPVAANLTTARSNASSNPTLISDLSQASDAVRLTLVAGTNNSTWAAYSTYNDTSSARLENWILPQLIPQSNGSPSNGYAINLYDGDPAASGTLVSTTDGTTGTGIDKTVGWIFNYASGILILSDDFKSNISDPYVVGFRYIGNTANSGATGGSANTIENSFIADESISIGQVLRVVTSADSGLTAGRVVRATASSVVGSEVLGIAKTAATQGNSVTVVQSGVIPMLFGSALAASNNGKKVYLDTTTGQATVTIPSGSGETVVQVGILSGANGSTSTPNVAIKLGEPVTLG